MLEHLSSEQLANIAGRGGSLVVNGRKFSSEQLGNVAGRLQPGATLHVTNSAKFSSEQMGNIAGRAKTNGAHVMFS